MNRGIEQTKAGIILKMLKGNEPLAKIVDFCDTTRDVVEKLAKENNLAVTQ